MNATTSAPRPSDTRPSVPAHPRGTLAEQHPRETPAPIGRVIGVLGLRPALIIGLGLLLLATGTHLIWMNGLVILVDLIALLVVHRALRAEGRSLLDLFRPWRWVDLAWGALLLVIVTIGFFAATFLANAIVYQGAPPAPTGATPSIPLWFALIGVLVMPLSIAIAEEAVYRGYAQPRLGRHLGTVGSLLTVALIFGIQHIGFSLTDPQALLARVITTALAGLMFGLLMLWMRRIAPLTLAHWGLDVLGLGLPMLLLALA